MNLTEVNLQLALEEALTAAAPDGGSWLAGKETFVNYIGGRKRPWRFRDEQFSPRQLRERTGENHPPSNMKGRSR